MLGDDLLSHGETPHYHRRCCVSRLSSGWDQVVPQLYGRQAKLSQSGFKFIFDLEGVVKLNLVFLYALIRYFLSLFVCIEQITCQTPWALYGQASRAISIG